MDYISVLGPQGTFSDIAANKYLDFFKYNFEIKYFQTITKTGEAANTYGHAILPFENTLDGYVLDTIDLLSNNEFKILSEIYVKVKFCFVTNAKKIEDVKKVYVQFKAKGQCVDFISNYDFDFIITQSNIESYDLLKNSDNTFGAIIPIHKLDMEEFETIICDITDLEANETRFIAIGPNNELPYLNNKRKCSLMIYFKEDKPGLLYEILRYFEDSKINLSSILSRPARTKMGVYNLYFEFNFNDYEEEQVNKMFTLMNNNKNYEIKVFGIYSQIE